MKVEFKLVKLPKGSGGIRYEALTPGGESWTIYVPQEIMVLLVNAKSVELAPKVISVEITA